MCSLLLKPITISNAVLFPEQGEAAQSHRCKDAVFTSNLAWCPSFLCASCLCSLSCRPVHLGVVWGQACHLSRWSLLY